MDETDVVVRGSKDAMDEEAVVDEEVELPNEKLTAAEDAVASWERGVVEGGGGVIRTGVGGVTTAAKVGRAVVSFNEEMTGKAGEETVWANGVAGRTDVVTLMEATAAEIETATAGV